MYPLLFAAASDNMTTQSQDFGGNFIRCHLPPGDTGLTTYFFILLL